MCAGSQSVSLGQTLGLNRGTTNGACFFVFAVLTLAHDSNCLVVEWDTFWFGFNHPLEIFWVTPSLATALVYLSELGFWTWYAVALSFCSSFFFVGLGQRSD